MFNLNKFISDSVTHRPVSMFATDIEANKERLSAEIYRRLHQRIDCQVIHRGSYSHNFFDPDGKYACLYKLIFLFYDISD